MKNTVVTISLIALALLITACPGPEAPANNTEGNAANENTNTATQPAENASAAVIDLETKAYEAWKSKDGKFFEGMLADNFVSNGLYTDKAGLVKLVSENPCEVKDVKLEGSKTVDLAEGVVLVTAKVVSDFNCEGKPGLSPTYAAGVYVKSGDEWKAGFHQSVPASDAKGEPSANTQSSPAAGTDELTKTLSEMENRWWQEWKDKKTDYFENETSDGFVQLGAEGVLDKATALKNMKDEPCEVKSFATTGFRATQITDNIAVLTYNATQEGVCRENAIPGKVYSTSIFVKDGDSWKGAFYAETPGAGGGK